MTAAASKPPRRPRRAATAKPSAPPPPARARLELDARRAQLLAIGLERFSAQPYDAVSIDDVARAAGISKGLLYHYYPTKRAFYAAVIAEAARVLLARTEPDASLPPEARLREGLEAYLTFVEERGDAFAALMRSGIGSDAEVARIVDDTRRRYLERLLAGVAAPPHSPLLRTAVRGWIGFAEAASLDWVEHRDIDRDTLRAALVTQLLAALAVAGVDATATPLAGAREAT